MQGVKARKPESSEAMKLGWQIGYMAEDARHTMLVVIDNFEFLVLNYYLDTDHTQNYIDRNAWMLE